MNRYFLGRILIVAGLLLNVASAQAGGVDAAWQQAKSSDSIESLRNFIRENPASSHLGDAAKGLYAQSLATHKMSDLKNFVEEFYDFPEVKKAKVAYLDLLRKQTGLESRFSLREGKIGTLYVPSVTNSYGSTTTRYINGNAVNETTYHDSTSGGYNSDRYGFTAVYQIFNESSQAYIVRVRASGSSTMSDMHTGTKSWSADEYNYSTRRKSKISQERSYLIKAKDSIKDQVVTGETKPVDFKLEIISAEPVSNEWMAKLQEALASEKRQESAPDGWFAAMKFKAKRYISEYTKPSVEQKLTLLSRYLADPKAEKWHKALQNRYSEIAEKNITISIATGARFDRDFSSNVDVIFENHTGHFVQVNFDPNFDRKGYVQLGVGANKRVSLTAKGVSKDSLNVDVTSIVLAANHESSSSVGQYTALQQQYRQGVKARAQAAREKAAKAAGFVINGDGTVTDKKTGLMWKQCSEGLSGSVCEKGTIQGLAWNAALQRARDLNKHGRFAGYSDWRVPTKEELLSLVRTGKPTINHNAFPATAREKYWSASPCAGSATCAWLVGFDFGNDSTYGKSYDYYVRLVRGGQ